MNHLIVVFLSIFAHHLSFFTIDTVTFSIAVSDCFLLGFSWTILYFWVLTSKSFSCEGGCSCLPGRCIRQREVSWIKERTRCSPLWWSISQCPLPCFGQQDRYSICCLRRRVAVPPWPCQLHHRQGKGELGRLKCSSTRGLHV